MMGMIGGMSLSVEVGESNAIGVEVCAEMAAIKSGKTPIYRRSFVRVTTPSPSAVSRVRCLSKRGPRRKRKRP